MSFLSKKSNLVSLILIVVSFLVHLYTVHQGEDQAMQHDSIRNPIDSTYISDKELEREGLLVANGFGDEL